MLSNDSYHPVHKLEKPTLVFLHGLLGSGYDWCESIALLNQYSCITIDLPGHGRSAHSSCANLDECCSYITETLTQILEPNQPIYLIGYSLGGRVAMHGVARNLFQKLNLQGLVIEGGNFGLKTAQEKRERLINDENWANRFIHEPIEQVLFNWYQQSVFSSLNDEQRQLLVSKRSDNLGPSIAHMLLATSLAKQEYLREVLIEASLPIHYVCGGKDNKFSTMAKESGLSFSVVSGAGHNVHQECPNEFTKIIMDFIQNR
ncbi:2-succinyl-6-hydroxy-2,4-cyclohexadiene-1-carboxylate synthase [Vibrio sp. 10N.261.55.A7]|uniref:2-succinyl-6-hydroxy-2, 4-cyclohexadiene-1-carboxylate synthase n=1 Tax=Vibrio sp. 10N.261.55.A7 TaxID=1880851 RepID=UPI000C83CA10|nr:2-succinyl-6-hydroxy-2,4-cyclohexadiene-1-carboxylate synthase [Vibrio sp. 10N.261.55.A7]PMJ90875.1 2-succinyl-6-hydroxy-2,4-cyclohexadiene-1-carboxylate synthase [Vibrio sp. 10N.261.55.A7]